MLAPRRIGKTWLLKRIAEDMAAAGWNCIQLDVEGMRTEDEFLRALCREIEKQQDMVPRLLAHLSQRFRQLTEDFGKEGLTAAIGRVPSREFLETLIASLDGEGRDTLILIDEIALFVLNLARQDAEATRTMLYLLRGLMQRYAKVRWFLTGSIGLDVVARRHNMLGAMLGYDVFPLEPFSAAAARSFIDDLQRGELAARPFDLEPDAFEHFTVELGWLSPYYIRQTMRVLQPTAATSDTGRPRASIADIERAFAKLLTPPQRLHFVAWEEHIAKNFEKVDSEQLWAILDVLSEAPDGEITATLQARLANDHKDLDARQIREQLTILANDGYIHQVDNRWRFLSGLLRRFWQQYNHK